ncbi:MAG: tetratricopeptide repeat protein [Spirochaetaceae bacterium]|jgi:tetratricopeptide (TPR) repeat protein|nr:tetratricopeptide repeat protein [Spirochaetaceae bacterium]
MRRFLAGLTLILALTRVYAQSVPAGLQWKAENAGVTITKYTGNASVLTIPDKINGLPVLSIGNSAFDGCGNLTSVVLPNSVTAIGDYTFAFCGSLQSVTIPNSVESIGYRAFAECRSLKNVTLPRGAQVGGYAFPNGVQIRYSDVSPGKPSAYTEEIYIEGSGLLQYTLSNDPGEIEKAITAQEGARVSLDRLTWFENPVLSQNVRTAMNRLDVNYSYPWKHGIVNKRVGNRWYSVWLPGTAPYAYNQGLEYYNKKDYNKAIPEFTKAIQLNPNNDSYYYNRGNAYYMKKDYDKAIPDYEASLRINPNHTNAKTYLAYSYDARGNTYYVKKDYDKAIADYTQAIQINPNDSAYSNRGNAYYGKKDWDKAIADYEAALRINPNHANAKTFLANARQQKAQTTSASSGTASSGNSAQTATAQTNAASSRTGNSYKGIPVEVIGIPYGFADLCGYRIIDEAIEDTYNGASTVQVSKFINYKINKFTFDFKRDGSLVINAFSSYDKTPAGGNRFYNADPNYKAYTYTLPASYHNHLGGKCSLDRYDDIAISQAKLNEMRKDPALNKVYEVLLSCAQDMDYDWNRVGRKATFVTPKPLTGVCDDYANLLIQRLTAAKIPGVTDITKVTGQNHAWVTVQYQGKTLYLDATWFDTNSIDKNGVVDHVPYKDPREMTFDNDIFTNHGKHHLAGVVGGLGS